MVRFTPSSCTGKERDEETGYSYFGARYMDHALLTGWLSVDPMADKYPSLSPYNYCAWNPIKLVDPDGNEVAPIYDREGNFLGTDNKGLQGKAIVMRKENFKQGMSHDDALKNNEGVNGLNGNDARSKLKKHFDGLKNRPDWDGVVTRAEGIAWAKEHPGAKNHPTPDNTLYINAAMLDFGEISTSDLENGVGQSSPINTLTSKNLRNGLKKGKLQNTVYALGRVDLFLLNEAGDIRVVNNNATDYDWNTGGGFKRDVLIRCERLLNGLSDIHGFKTYYYGTGRVKK